MSVEGETITEYRAVGITGARRHEGEWTSLGQARVLAKQMRPEPGFWQPHERVLVEMRDVTYGPVRVWPEAQDVG